MKTTDRKNNMFKIGMKLKCVENATSFMIGAHFADYHPNWKEDIPKYSELENGLPKLYLCQVLCHDMAFEYRYSYRIGFINKEGKWNIESKYIRVTRYLDIHCDEDETQLLTDIKRVYEELA